MAVTEAPCPSPAPPVNRHRPWPAVLGAVLVLGAAPAADLGEVSARPESGASAEALARWLEREAPAAGLVVRRDGLGGAAGRGRCPAGTRFTGGRLSARLERQLDLSWVAPSGCIAAEVRAPWRRDRPEASVREALEALARALRATDRSSAVSTAETDPPAAVELYPNEDDLAQTTRQKSEAALDRADPRLAAAVRARLHLRYRPGSELDTATDGPRFVREVLIEALGIDPGETLIEMIESGPKIPFDPNDPDADLEPGDIVMMVSFGWSPRFVMLYVGGGSQAQATAVRNVVVEPVPTKIPMELYLVAVRPRGASR